MLLEVCARGCAQLFLGHDGEVYCLKLANMTTSQVSRVHTLVCVLAEFALCQLEVVFGDDLILSELSTTHHLASFAVA